MFQGALQICAKGPTPFQASSGSHDPRPRSLAKARRVHCTLKHLYLAASDLPSIQQRRLKFPHATDSELHVHTLSPNTQSPMWIRDGQGMHDKLRFCRDQSGSACKVTGMESTDGCLWRRV